MGLDFGNIENQSKSVCFSLPNTAPLFDALKFPNLNLKLPKLGLPDFSKLNFGLGKLTVTLPSIKLKSPSFTGLKFGGLDNLRNKIGAIKIPTTICINIGGEFGFDSVFSQIGDVLDALVPKLPTINLFEGGTFNIFPQLLINPAFPIDLSFEQVLAMAKDNCLQSILNALRAFDPFERLKKLFELAAQMCSEMLFDKLRAVIDEIQKAQAEIIANALNAITDPFAKLAKLIDMANDALNAGAFSALEEITKLLGSTQFDSLLDFIDKLDPTVAFAALKDAIRNLVQLQNFGPIAQLLSIMQILKSKLAGITDLGQAGLNLPEMTIDALQNAINKLLDDDDLLGIQRLLSDFMRNKFALVDQLKALDPASFLNQMLPLLNSALKNFEFGLFNALLKELTDKICLESATT